MDNTTQDRLNQIFMMKLDNSGLYREYDEDVSLIRRVLKSEGKVEISYAEAFEFWTWRSDQYEASWLLIREGILGEKEIMDWFNIFLDEFWPKTNEILTK